MKYQPTLVECTRFGKDELENGQLKAKLDFCNRSLKT